MPMIGARFYTQLDAVQLRSDSLESELSKELENGRLFRLLVKLATINERPDLNMELTWAETGDRYMLKLFRDYVFHQVTADGRPWLDMAHVVSCLNKLDCGSPDKVSTNIFRPHIKIFSKARKKKFEILQIIVILVDKNLQNFFE